MFGVNLKRHYYSLCLLLLVSSSCGPNLFLSSLIHYDIFLYLVLLHLFLFSFHVTKLFFYILCAPLVYCSSLEFCFLSYSFFFLLLCSRLLFVLVLCLLPLLCVLFSSCVTLYHYYLLCSRASFIHNVALVLIFSVHRISVP